jgi:ribosomal protein L37AE/L43A
MTTSTPHKNEDEYFAKQDAELIKERRARLDHERKSSERASHYMKCPKCGADLQERQYHHIKIDICPECRGAWMDAGEIDMLNHVKRNEFSRFVGSMFGLK